MKHITSDVLVEGLFEVTARRRVPNITTLSASTLNLNSLSNELQIFIGTVAGQIVVLPDATTLQPGHHIEFFNYSSSASLEIRDAAGNSMAHVEPFDKFSYIVRDVSTVAGAWIRKHEFPDSFNATYPGTGLIVTIAQGYTWLNGVYTFLPTSNITLPASSTGVIYIDIANTLQSTTGIVPHGAVPLYLFTTSGSAVTALQDARPRWRNQALFGSNYGTNSDLTITTNNSQAVYNTKVTLNVPNIPAGANGRLGYAFSYTTAANNRNIDFILMLDGVTTLLNDTDSIAGTSTAYNVVSGFVPVTALTAGTRSFTLQYRVGALGATTVSIKNAMLEFWRTS